MGRKGSKTHKWTEDELKLLLEMVQDATPMLEHYQRQGYTQTDWWASVSGMLFQRGGPVVTGKACARQFELWMDRQEPLERQPEDLEAGKWEHIAAMVDAVARDLGVKETRECGSPQRDPDPRCASCGQRAECIYIVDSLAAADEAYFDDRHDAAISYILDHLQVRASPVPTETCGYVPNDMGPDGEVFETVLYHATDYERDATRPTTYRLRDSTVTAQRWFRLGDHVAVQRHPLDNDEERCPHCLALFLEHGWIRKTPVCPGDWIIGDAPGPHYPCSVDLFEVLFEPVQESKSE